ncbi:MAG: hypothetical protein KH354_04945 [Clostridiales bacterium]|nr:hypothetical protein [Clostridiales bacterium]
MKRKIAVCITVLLCLISLCLLTACDSGAISGSHKATEFVCGKKYLSQSAESDSFKRAAYYKFDNDGSGEYYYYYQDNGSGAPNIIAYTVTFKYIYVDESTVMCFYDGVAYHEEHNRGKEVASDWSRALLVSENVILESSGGNKYLNEDYIKTLPNFCK